MKKIFIGALALLTSFAANAQEKTDFKITGEPIVTVFANYKIGIDDASGVSGFNLDRAYLGYKTNFAKNLSARVVFDIGTSKVEGSSLERIAFVKNAMVSWEVDNFTLDVGLINLNQFALQDKLWGYRYVSRSFQDLSGFGSSADLGVNAAYKFNKWLSADFSLTNGEGYKKLNVDDQNRYSLGVTAKPIEGLTLRAYYDIYDAGGEIDGGPQPKNQQTFSTFAAYTHRVFFVGAEYVIQSNNDFENGNTASGYSISASADICKNFKAFGRYDSLNFRNNWGWNDDDGSRAILGIEYSPIKYIKISPNYQTQESKGGGVTSYIYLSLSFNL